MNTVGLYKVMKSSLNNKKLGVGCVPKHHSNTRMKQIHTDGVPLHELNGGEEFWFPLASFWQFSNVQREAIGRNLLQLDPDGACRFVKGCKTPGGDQIKLQLKEIVEG